MVCDERVSGFVWVGFVFFLPPPPLALLADDDFFEATTEVVLLLSPPPPRSTNTEAKGPTQLERLRRWCCRVCSKEDCWASLPALRTVIAAIVVPAVLVIIIIIVSNIRIVPAIALLEE